jgi:hypothetical protein
VTGDLPVEPRPNQIRSLNLIREFLGRSRQLEEVSDTAGVRHQCGGLGHPAHDTEQWRSIESTGWQVRQSDYAFLTSQQAREILDAEGITVIDYRPLQQAWNTGGRR